MSREDIIRLLAQLPHYSDRHNLPPMDMAFLTHVRLTIADNHTLTEGEQQRLLEIAKGYTEV